MSAFVLLVGLLGTLTMIDTANSQTADNRAREGANNLGRAIIENARAISYLSLAPAGVVAALQGRPLLEDSTPDTVAWTIERRGTTYTVEVTTCIYDDPKDHVNVAARAGAPYCATSPSTGAPGLTGADANPDDFRRVDVTVRWSSRARPARVYQRALVINPSGGLGPRLMSFVATSTGGEHVTVDQTAASTEIAFAAASAPAASMHWRATDGASAGDAEPGAGGESWSFAWDLGAVDEPGAVLDGSYEVTAQAFDGVGIPGDQRTVTVTVDRSLPFAPDGLVGGRNDRLTDIVDLQWLPLRERDIVGYRVFRAPSVGGPETLVCAVPASTTACRDDEPSDDAAVYRVRGVDLNVAFGNLSREGADSAPLSVGVQASPRPEFAVNDLEVAADGELTWSAATDPDGSVAFYRIYRGGSAYADRIDRTETSAPRYAARIMSPAPQTYWVTAVDDSFNESEPIGPVTLTP